MRSRDSKVGSNECARAAERAAPSFDARIPQRPSMDHARPDLECYGHLGGTCYRSQADGIIKQRLRRSNLNQHRGQAAQIGIKRGEARIFPIHPNGNIRRGEFF